MSFVPVPSAGSVTSAFFKRIFVIFFQSSTFKVFGFKKIRILNGGFSEWTKNNLPVTNKINKADKSNFICNSFESKRIVNKKELEKMLIRENRMEIFKKCLSFLDTRVELDQNGFKFDIFEH